MKQLITRSSSEAVKKRALLAIFLTIFVSLVGFGIIIPLLPAYAEKFQANELTIGLMLASFSIAQLIASPILGNWSDRYGRRPVIVISMIGSVISFVMLAMAGSLTMLFLSRIVDGLSGGNITTARAYIADTVDEKDRAKSYGLIGAAFGLGFIFGPLLGGILVSVSLTAPYWAAAILAAIAAFIAYLWMPESVHQSNAKRPSPWKEMPRLFQTPMLGRLLWVNFLVWVAFSIYQTSFTLFAQRQFGFNESQVGYTLALVGVCAVAVQLGLIGRVVHRFGESRALLTGLITCSIGLALGAFTHQVLILIPAVILATIGGALATPTLTSLVSKAANPKEQGLVQGVNGGLESLARIIGPIWGNAVLKYSTSAAYASAALLLLLIFVVGLFLRLEPSSSKAPAEETLR